MSDWHFGMDYDMWLYPEVDWRSPDYNYELPEPILAANIEGTMLINAEDAIEQVHILQAENSKLRELVRVVYSDLVDVNLLMENNQLKAENAKLRELARFAWDCIHCGVSCDDCRLTFGGCTLQSIMRELGVKVDDI